MENSNEKLNLKNQKYNQKLYKIYKMISWDLLFYYAISFLFLTQEKGLSTSEIIFADAFYPIFKLIFQLPCTMLIEKIGKKKSLILANLSVFTYVLIVMGLSTKYGYIVANVFCAFGFIIKGIAESNILYDSIENSENKRTIFSKIDSSGSSLYYVFDAITSAVSGFLFVVNPYIPMTLCLFLAFCSFILACKFKEIPITENMDSEESAEENFHKNLSFGGQLQNYIRNLKQAFKFILKSNRLRALIIFYALFSNLISILTTVRRSLLKELAIPNEYFGILFAVWELVAAFSVRSATRIQNKHGNNTLTFLSISYVLSVIFAGLTSILIGLPPFLVYFIVLCMMSIQYIVKGPFQTLIQRYLGSFSTSTMRTKISSASLMIENITCTIISFMVSYLTNHVSSALSTLIIGVIFMIIILIILHYMKSRVGLKPEEYPESDIKFNELY